MPKEERDVVVKGIGDQFDADIAPTVEKIAHRFKPQGQPSFINEFYRLYRRWIKNE